MRLIVCVYLCCAPSSYYKSELMRDITTDLISPSNGTHPRSRISAVLFFMCCINMTSAAAHVSLAFIEFLFFPRTHSDAAVYYECVHARQPGGESIQNQNIFIWVCALCLLNARLRRCGSRACTRRTDTCRSPQSK